MTEELSCVTCKHLYKKISELPCSNCEDNSKWEESIPQWVVNWLSSFNTDSATKCFEAVNLLKERLEGER